MPFMPLRARAASLALFFVATVGCLGCDQLTKEIARAHLFEAGRISLAAGTIELVLVENTGAFMSLGSSLPESIRQLALQVAVPAMLCVLCIAVLRRASLSRLELLALALVAGGGAGNWLDRLLQEGAVTDFVRVGFGPLRTGVFNVADVAILAGAAVLFLAQLPAEKDDAPRQTGG